MPGIHEQRGQGLVVQYHPAEAGEVFPGDQQPVIVQLGGGDGDFPAAQAHVRGFIDGIHVDGLLIAVEGVVFQQFQLGLVVLAAVVIRRDGLVEAGDGTPRIAQLTQHVGVQTVGLQVDAFKGMVEVVPDHVFGGVDVVGGEHVRRQAQRRQVIPVGHHHGGLVEGGQRVDQLFQEGVGIGQRVDIVLEGRQGQRLRQVEDFDIPLSGLVAFGVFAVGFHGDAQRQVPPLGAPEYGHDLVGQYLVPRPAQRIGVDVLHVFHRHEAIEAQPGIDRVAVVERGAVVVQRGGGVAVRLQVVGHGFAVGLLQYGAVGGFAGGKVIQVHAGDDLELGVHRASADGGDVELAAGALLLEPVEERRRVAADAAAPNRANIDERFQLYEHDVGLGRVVVLVEDLWLGLAIVNVFQNLAHGFIAVIAGPGDAHLAEGIGKHQREAIVVVVVHQAVEALGQQPRAYARGFKHDAQQQAAHKPHQGLAQVSVLTPGGAGKQHDNQGKHEENAKEYRDDLGQRGVDGQQRQRLPDQQQVHGREGRRAILGDDVLDHAKEQPQKADRAQHGDPVQEELRKHQRGQHDQYVEQEDQRGAGDELEQAGDGQPPVA